MLASDGKRKGLSLFHSPGQQQIQVYFNLLQGSLEKEQSRYNVFGSYIIHSPYQNYKKLKSEKLWDFLRSPVFFTLSLHGC